MFDSASSSRFVGADDLEEYAEGASAEVDVELEYAAGLDVGDADEVGDAESDEDGVLNAEVVVRANDCLAEDTTGFSEVVGAGAADDDAEHGPSART